jgi:peptidoglycan/LPS O-acetylase OafA/YrhL
MSNGLTTTSLATLVGQSYKDQCEMAYEKFVNKPHFHSLDGLRCLSILAVIWHHVAGDTYPSSSILSTGHHGVSLFFVISGFLITSLLLREKSKKQTIDLKHFYFKRSLRIFPLYYLVILIYVILVYIVEGESSYAKSFFSNLVFFLTYTSNYFVSLTGDRVIFYFAWSLAAEEQFYLVWPAVEKWLSDKMAILLAFACIALALTARAVFFSALQDSIIIIIFDNIAIPICVGVIFAHLLNNKTMFSWVYMLVRYKLCGPLYLALTIIILVNAAIPLLFAYAAMALLLVSVIISKQHVLYYLLNNPICIAVGKVSYGMYLFHMLALNLIRRLGSDFALSEASLFILTSVLVFIIASVSFRYFESFFLNQKDYFTKKNERYPVATVAQN